MLIAGEVKNRQFAYDRKVNAAAAVKILDFEVIVWYNYKAIDFITER